MCSLATNSSCAMRAMRIAGRGAAAFNLLLVASPVARSHAESGAIPEAVLPAALRSMTPDAALAYARARQPEVRSALARLVLGWPLFDATTSAQSEASRAEKNVRRDQVAAALRYEEAALIRLAYGKVAVAGGRARGSTATAALGRRGMRQLRAGFSRGLGTSVELAAAEAVRIEAELQSAFGEFELARARAAFRCATAETL